jgi:GTP1/Obg family GTP-binding protein
MTARTARTTQRSRTKKRTPSTAREGKVDSAKLLQVYTDWHSKVWAILNDILQSVYAISQVADDPDELLSEYVDSASIKELLSAMREANSAMSNLMPPMKSQINLPDVLACC